MRPLTAVIASVRIRIAVSSGIIDCVDFIGVPSERLLIFVLRPMEVQRFLDENGVDSPFYTEREKGKNR